MLHIHTIKSKQNALIVDFARDVALKIRVPCG